MTKKELTTMTWEGRGVMRCDECHVRFLDPVNTSALVSLRKHPMEYCPFCGRYVTEVRHDGE